MNFFPVAYANSAAQQNSPWSTVAMLLVFFGIFYFLLVRPQQKRAKQHRAIMTALARNDEVVMTSGIMGKITAIEDNTLTVEIAPNINIKIQKAAVSAVLPKDSLKF